MDTVLLNIAQAAEQGVETPAVHVITCAGDLIVGMPCSTEDFRELTWPHYKMAVAKAVARRPRQERKNQPLDKDALATERYVAVGPANDPGSPVLNICNAVLSFGGRGDGMELPAIRIPVDCVSSWWIAGEKYKKEAASFFVGGSIPLNLGN